MNKKKIAVLVGSLRKESFNRKVANQLIRLAPDSLELEIVEIGQLNKICRWFFIRYTRIQPVGSQRAEKCFRRCFETLWTKRLGWKTGSGCQRIDERHRWIWRQSYRASIDGFSECSHDAATRGVYRKRPYSFR